MTSPLLFPGSRRAGSGSIRNRCARHPILIGGTGERKTLRMVAEHADGWHAGFPDHPTELEPKVEALLDWCDHFGRDPADIEWGIGLEPEDKDQVLDEHAGTYLEMGFTQFTLGYDGPDWDVERRR